MRLNREEQIRFLELELRAQTEAFRQKLDTSAIYMLQETEELFVAQFLQFQDGEMILKFSNNRGFPRLGEYLYCFTVPKHYRDYRNWDEATYGDLIKLKDNYTECVSIWQAPSKNEGFSIIGFRGISTDYYDYLKSAQGLIMVLGPQKPPYEYISNLQKIVGNRTFDSISEILDISYTPKKINPYLLDKNINDTITFLLAQLKLQDTLIIQGPPGTGKTYLIAELIQEIINDNTSILVTALTNRALIEIIEKPSMQELLNKGVVCKTNLSIDEAKLHPQLKPLKEVHPEKGKIILSTFYMTSGYAADLTTNKPFDYVIVDEASQALLAMFAAAKMLGQNNIWVGDIKQLSPIVLLSEDIITRNEYSPLVMGLKTQTETDSIPSFQLINSYRLPQRACDYTGIFYDNSLRSKADLKINLYFQDASLELKHILSPKGGPILIKTNLEIGNYKPQNGISLISKIVADLITLNEKLHISVLSHFIITTKSIQKEIYSRISSRQNILVETVSKIQGLTTDICIFFIPNLSYHRSLEQRLFNVATSRAKRHTIIITDTNILKKPIFDKGVQLFLEKLERESSFEIDSVKLEKR